MQDNAYRKPVKIASRELRPSTVLGSPEPRTGHGFDPLSRSAVTIEWSRLRYTDAFHPIFRSEVVAFAREKEAKTWLPQQLRLHVRTSNDS